MRREPEYFGDTEVELLYIAKKLRDALKLESLLTEHGIDYLVEPDKYQGGFLFRSERVGAFFYVAPESLDSSRRFLSENGYKPHDLGKS